MKNNKLWTTAILGAVVVSLAAPLVMQALGPSQATVERAATAVAPRAGDLVYGQPDAPVSVLALVSLTCPHCAAWEHEQLPLVLDGDVKAGRARLIVRDFPLNKPALEAAALVRCLPEVARPAAHRKLLATMSEWAGKDMTAIAGAAGVSGEAVAAATACAAKAETQDAIIAGAAEAAKTYGVQSTPSFVVGNKMIKGGVRAEELAKLVAETAAAR